MCEENAIEHDHHLVPRSKGGSDTLANIADLCGGCHTLVHTDQAAAETLAAIKVGQNKKYGALSVLNQIIPYLVEALSQKFHGNIRLVSGWETKQFRDENHIDNDHDIDAYCIAVLGQSPKVLDVPETHFLIWQFRRHDRAKIPRETLANWCIITSRDYLYPIYELLHNELLHRDIIHADETVCQVLRENGKTAQSTSYMWIYRSGSDGLPGIVMYEYQPGRSGDYPRNFLEGFHGLLQCDCYQGYNKVEDVLLICCMAHCRRKFYKALPAERKKSIKLLDINSPEALKELEIPETDLDKYIPAEIGVAYCNKLFYLERTCKDLAPDERKAKRSEQETPVWDAFLNWLSGLNPTKGSKLEKAVNYAQNHKDSLQTYLQDGRCELSNNAAE